MNRFIMLTALLFASVVASVVPGVVAAQVPNLPTPSVPTGPAPIPAAPVLGANSYILQDFYSQQVLVEHNADMRVEPASITKLMTSYVVFKELAAGKIKLEDTVVVSETAWRTGGSRMFIDPSMSPTILDLIKGMVIQSGNDACVALAEHIAGTEEAFADLMNHYAKELGMAGTHFVNSTGLPHEEHYTNARDVALLSSAIINEFPDYYAWYSEKEFTFNEIRQHNRNTLLWRDPAIDGLKTGHTESAGYCLASSALRDGMRLVAAVMGSDSESSRASESQTLLNYGFRFYETIQLYEAKSVLATAKVWKGTVEEVNTGLDQPLFITIQRGRYDDLDAKVELQSELIAPLAEGAVVGNINVSLDDQAVASRDLVTLAAVEEAGFMGRSWDGLMMWIDGWGDDE
ncbi:MAG: D-alanyl-D-alanine carboxypeptidase family protein [Xanthomonadales bacterium]|nr:D-alanyl-D-alanine carboxypeptidase family protein [Xanthomonadales bacterium]